MLDDDHAVADLGQLGEDVRADEDRLALPASSLEQLAQLDAGARVEAGRRLVHDQHRRIVHQRPGHADALLHALGQGDERASRGCR